MGLGLRIHNGLSGLPQIVCFMSGCIIGQNRLIPGQLSDSRMVYGQAFRLRSLAEEKLQQG